MDQMARGTLFSSWRVDTQSKGQQGVTCFNVFAKNCALMLIRQRMWMAYTLHGSAWVFNFFSLILFLLAVQNCMLVWPNYLYS